MERGTLKTAGVVRALRRVWRVLHGPVGSRRLFVTGPLFALALAFVVFPLVLPHDLRWEGRLHGPEWDDRPDTAVLVQSLRQHRVPERTWADGQGWMTTGRFWRYAVRTRPNQIGLALRMYSEDTREWSPGEDLTRAVPLARAIWEDVLSGNRVEAVRHEGSLVWAVEGDLYANRAALLLVSTEKEISWRLVGCVPHFAGLSAVGDTAWLGGGHAPVAIASYDRYGDELQRLPEARYRLPYGSDPSTRFKSLKPLTYVEGIAANEDYLWAWFMGGMIMVNKLEGKPDWQPHRYAAQLSDAERYFYPRKGWAWRDRLVCLAAPGDSFGVQGWPTRVCVVSAGTPQRGTRYQPPPRFSGYTLRTGDMVGDYLWVLGENDGRKKGFTAAHWALIRIHLPDLTWELQSLPAGFQSWKTKSTDPTMCVCDKNLVVGSTLGPGGAGDLVLVQLDRGAVTPLNRENARVTEIDDLELDSSMLWVAHEGGLSRTRPVVLNGPETMR